MKQICTITIIVILFLINSAFGQSNLISININEQTSADTLLKPLLGVISGPDPCPNSVAPNLTPHLHDIGITSIRNNDYWDDRLDMELMFRCPDNSTYPSWRCDPNDPNNYDWYLSDLQFQSYLDGGFEPFFRLGGEHQCNTRLHDYNGPRDALEESNWIQAAIKVVQRYNNWNGKKNVLNYINIWTEFPNVKFWDRPNQAFFEFWADAYEALKDEFPQLKIGGPGFLPSLSIAFGQVETGKGKVIVDFLSHLYARDISPDWIGWHLFDNRPENFYRAAQNYRHLLNGTGIFSNVPWAGTDFFQNVELICDAYMSCNMVVDSLGSVSFLTKAEDFKLCNKQKGAAVVSAMWTALQYTDTEKAYYYRCGDPDSKPVADANDPDASFSRGLFYGDSAGTYKPLAHAVRFWSKLCNNYPKLLSTGMVISKSIENNFWTLAAEGGHNSYAVLVANTGESLQNFSIIIKGNTLTYPEHSVQYFIVNDDQTGQEAFLWEGGNFSIEAENVMLIEIKMNPSNVQRKNSKIVSNFKLDKNYPNPFNSSTTINYQLARPGKAEIVIYNVLGEKIKTLVNKEQQSGAYSITWDGTDRDGNAVSSGIYYYQLVTNEYSSPINKMIFLK